MRDFMMAALPLVVAGIALAVFFAGLLVGMCVKKL